MKSIKTLLRLILMSILSCSGLAQDVDDLLTLLQQLGDSKQADTLDLKSILCNDIAVMYQGLDDNHQARTYFLQSVEFARERIELSGVWDAQNNYDMASLYQNLSIFEATVGNDDQSESYNRLAEKYFLRLKPQLSGEEYRSILAHFYESTFVRYYHNQQYELAEESLEKSIELSEDLPFESQLELQRLKVELNNARKDYPKAIRQARELLILIEEKADKSMVNEHQYLHGLLSGLYHNAQYEDLIHTVESRSDYQSIEAMESYAASNPREGLTSFLNNLFILSYAQINIYKIKGDLSLLKKAFEIQQLAFRLAEEQTLRTNAELVGSTITNPKNKILALLIAAINLSEHEELHANEIFQLIRTIDVYQSTRLHLERISFALNAANWEQQKEWKHELDFINRKLDEAVKSAEEQSVVDSLRQTAYRLSQDLKALGKKTKYDKILDEYKVSRQDFQKDAQNFVKKHKKTVLVYFYERNESQDSVYILGISPDTAFIKANIIEGNFTAQIKQLYNYNSRFLIAEEDLKMQEKMNRKFYDLLIAPVEEFIQTEELLIYPVDEMSYISFDALLNAENQYLTESYAIQYTTSLYSLISQPTTSVDKIDLAAFYPHQYGIDSLAFLRYADKEVHEILEMSGGRGFIGREASIQSFIECADQSNILHLASHSVLNYQRPYESFILLDEDTDTTLRNNRLHAYEIFAKTFHSDLVILSSCNTANGEIEKGVGLVSLSNAFYFSGVPATVSSLWSAQDKSSSDLMISFYEALIAGESKAKSLQKARLNYLKNADKLKRQPFFWANYVLYGSDQALYQKRTKNNYMRWVWLAVGVILIIGFYRLFKTSRASAA
jgi:CHAT domain-containing protein